jgi:Secretion system C-terminal sorting domain
MKKILTLSAILMMAFALRAQLPAGSIAPNFNVTDINGNTHNLYAILDSGKSVIMDISATWCGPCWSFHRSKTLEKIHNQFGAAGTNEVRVLFVEGDSRTTLDNLNGIAGGAGTQGNWVAGTPYPIIDNASISTSYAITYFPTLYVICSHNRRLVEVTNKTVENIMTQARRCSPVAKATNNAAIRDYTGFNDMFCINKTFSPTIRVQNLGLDTARSIAVTLKKDGALIQTKTITAPLATYDTLALAFDNVTLNATSTLRFDITQVNNTANAATYRSNWEQTLTRGVVLQYDTVTVEIKTDVDVAETYWFIKDPNGVKVAEGGNPNVRPGARASALSNAGTYISAFTVYKHQVRLPSNICYEYASQDDWGDGFTNITNNVGQVIGTYGYFRVWKGTTTGAAGVLLYSGGDGNEFAEIKRPIERSYRVGTAELTEVGKMGVFPNPADGVLNLKFDLEANMPLNIEVTNPLGQTVYQVAGQNYAAGAHQLEIPTARLGNGMYFVTIKNEKAQIMRKFTVQH